MRGRAVLFAFLVVLAWTVQAATLTDARGRAVTLDKPAARIVSLAPHVTELIFAAGAGERLVAAGDFSDYPPAATRLPRVGNASHVDIERIVALAPDLVIGWKTGNNPGDIATIERLGFPVYVTEISTLSQIASAIEDIGVLAGTEQAATGAAADFQRRLDGLKSRYAGREPVSVFYQIWERPLMTINDRHLIADSIRLCGGRNVFATIEPIAAAVAVEAVIAADPQVIVSSASNEQGDAHLAAWRRWKTMTAVREGNLFAIPPDLIERPTPRILEGVSRLCEILDRARGSR